jgi:hypothetical protein
MAAARNPAVDVAAISQRQHLVKSHVVEPIARGLDRVDDRRRLGVAQPDDQVVAGPEVLEHRLRRPVLGRQRCLDAYRPRHRGRVPVRDRVRLTRLG